MWRFLMIDKGTFRTKLQYIVSFDTFVNIADIWQGQG